MASQCNFCVSLNSVWLQQGNPQSSTQSCEGVYWWLTLNWKILNHWSKGTAVYTMTATGSVQMEVWGNLTVWGYANEGPGIHGVIYRHLLMLVVSFFLASSYIFWTIVETVNEPLTQIYMFELFKAKFYLLVLMGPECSYRKMAKITDQMLRLVLIGGSEPTWLNMHNIWSNEIIFC